MNGHSCLYDGWVRHRRFQPLTHSFRYNLFLVYLDLAELDEIFRRRWFWSRERFNWASFHRADYLGPPEKELDTAVRDRIEEHASWRPTGRIGLLTHLRYFGWCMNPVSFYYCFDPSGSRIEALVAEINNTPWNERHAEILLAADLRRHSQPLRFRFAKSFHVSPFMDMKQEYHWNFSPPAERLVVHMENHAGGRRLFDATLNARRRPLTAWNSTRMLLRHPFMTGKVMAAIYWQALRLWWKGCPFHPHPKYRQAEEVQSVCPR